MTETARRVLNDVEHALNGISPSSQNERFRLYWFSVVGMLRAVGHVLKNVDSKASPQMKAAIDKIWNSLQRDKPHPSIFWDFIHEERNRFLKECKTAFSSSLITHYSNGEKVELIKDVLHGNGSLLASGVEVLSFFNDGPFKGKNPMVVAREAIYWWKAYLDEVDELANKGNKEKPISGAD